MNEFFQMRGCFTKYFKYILEKVVSTILLKWWQKALVNNREFYSNFFWITEILN